MNEISERVKRIPNSKIRGMMIQAYKKGAINLSQGSPGFDTPEHVNQAAIEAIQKGHTQYSPMNGYKELREAVSKKLGKYNKINANPETEILITAGAMAGLNAAITTLVDSGDEVIVISPVFPTYNNAVELCDGAVKEIPLNKDNLKLNIDDIQNAITLKTKLIILNTPQNPTGKILSKEELKCIADLAIDNDLFVLTDEIFEYFIYEGEHHSIASFPGMEDRTVTVSGFSKTYAMTGFRVGYLTCNKEPMEPIANIHTNLVICAPSIAQWAALSALEGPQACVTELVSKCMENRDLVYSKLSDIGFNCFKSEGSFYLFAETTEFGKDGDELAMGLLNNANVAVVPGSEFGEEWKNFIRINFAREKNELVKALDSIEKYIKNF